MGYALETELLLTNDNSIVSINRTNHTKDTNRHTNIKLDLSNLNQEDIKLYKQIVNDMLAINNFEKILFINNAFSILPLNFISELEDEKIIKSFNVNIVSSVLLLKTFISITKSLDIEKTILNITSGAAKYPIAKWSIYCLSKAAIEMFMESIRKEYDNFKVYSLDPGTIDTAMQKEIRKNIPENNYFINLKEKNLLNNPYNSAIKILKEVGL